MAFILLTLASMRPDLLWVTCALVAVLGGCSASDEANASRGETGGTGGGAAGDAGDGRHPNSPDTFVGTAVVHFEEVTLPETALSFMLASEGVAARLDVRQAYPRETVASGPGPSAANPQASACFRRQAIRRCSRRSHRHTMRFI